MAKKEEAKKDEFTVEIIDKDDTLSINEVMNNLNTDVMDKVADLVGKGILEIKGRISLQVHNPHVKDGDKDYRSFVYVLEDGNSIYTSSASFDTSYRTIVSAKNTMGIDGNIKVEVVEKDSKNNMGKMLLAKSAF